MREHRQARMQEHRVTIRTIAKPWTVILAFTGCFQLGRGAIVDGIFFLAIVALLVVDEIKPIRLIEIQKPRLAVMLAIAAVLGLAMVLAPRHGIVEGIVVSVIGLTLLILAWPDYEQHEKAKLAVRRAAILWSIIAVLICIIEVVSFLLGVPSDAAKFAHPSISLLLDPALDTVEGRVVFTALWLLVGIGLIRRGKH